MKKLLNKNWFYGLLLAIILLLFLIIRINNLKNFDTAWADDGGAQLTYIEILYNEHRLPTLSDTYLAWHEPAYYVLLASWIRGGEFLGWQGLNWWESLNIVIYFIFLILIWLSSYYYSEKNKWLALLNTFIFSVLFVGVKLSSYINNELLLHTLILLLLVLFWRWKLVVPSQEKKVIWWGIILALACLVKVTAWIIFLAVILFWLIKFLFARRKYFLKYIVLVFIVVSFLNLPWIIYKQYNYHGYFSINIYDDQPRQNILTSAGWQYIFAFNTHIFRDYPYWYSQPYSYAAILLSDSFGNYYNLFHNCTKMESLTSSQAIVVGNGQNTTPQLWQALLNTNRVALPIVIIWWLGFFAWVFRSIKQKKVEDYDLWLLIVMLGGWSASIFHNLRLPYLEAGVLKAHFIYFTYPILSFFAYREWRRILADKWWWCILAFVPWLIYLVLSWDILMVDYFV